MKVNDLEGSKGIITDDDKFLSTGGGGSNIVTDLETKTQNISLSGTTFTQTVMTADLKLGEGTDKNLQCGHIAAYSETCETKVECPTFRVNATTGGLIGYGGDERVVLDYSNAKLKLDSLASAGTVDISATQSINVNNKVVTTRTTFTDNQELVSKAYVDANSGGGAADTKTQNISESGTDSTKTLFNNDVYVNQSVVTLSFDDDITLDGTVSSGSIEDIFDGDTSTSITLLAPQGSGHQRINIDIVSIIAKGYTGNVVMWGRAKQELVYKQGNLTAYNPFVYESITDQDFNINIEDIDELYIGSSLLVEGNYRAVLHGISIGGVMLTNTSTITPYKLADVRQTQNLTATPGSTTVGGSLQTTGNVTLGSPEPDTSTYTSHTVDYSSTSGSTMGQTGFSFKISEPINITHLMISTSHWNPSQGFTNEQIDVNNLTSSGVQSGGTTSLYQRFVVTTSGYLTKIRMTYSSYNNNSYGTTTTMNIYSGSGTGGTLVGTSTVTKGADVFATLNTPVQVTSGGIYTIHIANSLGIIASSSSSYPYKIGSNGGSGLVGEVMSFATYVADVVSDNRNVSIWTGDAQAVVTIPDTTPIVNGYYELVLPQSINLTDISQTYTFTVRCNVNDSISSVELDSTNLNSVITDVVGRFSGANPSNGSDPFGDPGYPTGLVPNKMQCGNFKFTRATANNYRTLTCGNVYANNIIPSDHDSHNLGTESNRWNVIHAKTGYFAEQTIYLGDKWKLSVDETHPTNSSIKLSHASQGHASGVIDSEVVLANPKHTGLVVNHTGLAGDTAKTNNTVSGIVEDYTAAVAILEGQPVALDLGSEIQITNITSATPAWQIIGVATNACNAGGIVEVCTKGFCKVRRITTYETLPLKLLDGSTHLTNPVGLAWTFKDSGNDSNYSSSENYKITFDAQEGGNWNLTFNSFEFEHNNSSMYDRLGIETSDLGGVFTNVSIPWLQTSATSSTPWSTSFGGSRWDSASSKNGYVVPENTTRAILLGWNQQPVTINARYIRFTFYSDSSSTDPGWDITLVSSNHGAGNATVLPFGTPLYLDEPGGADYDKVSTTGSNIIGYAASADSSGDNIYCYIP